MTIQIQPKKQYVKDEFTGKVYKEETLHTVNAIDPNHWDTDIQNLEDKIVELQTQIEDIQNVQIPSAQAEKDDFFSQFPDLVPAKV